MDTKVLKDTKLKSPLINKKITIALIEETDNPLYKDSQQGTLLVGASKDFIAPLDSYGNIVDPLTDDEREYFEEILGLDLNVHKRSTPNDPTANFWTTKKSKVILRKTGHSIDTAEIVLDLSDPHQYILYKVALVSPRVANTWAERDDRPGEYEFVIKDGEVELEEELNYLEMDDTVTGYMLKHKNSKKKLFDLLRLYGSDKNSGLIKFDSSIEFIYNELRKLSRVKSEVRKLYKIITLGERDIHLQVFLADAVTIGLIEKRGTEYRLVGGDVIGGDHTSAISFLSDVKHQSIKLKIQQEIENFYKDK